MTLTTHGIIGTAAVVATTSLVGATPTGITLGFIAGFASHFVVDSIPHWSEGQTLLRSVRVNDSEPHKFDMVLGFDFLRDLSIIATDAIIGLVLSVIIFYMWLFHVPLYLVLLGVVAGDLPDALQFLYIKTHAKFMTPLQLFHERIQRELMGWHFLLTEVVLIAAVITLLKLSGLGVPIQ